MRLRRRAEPQDSTTSAEHCYRHVLDPGVERCGRCRNSMCKVCTVRVPRVGTLCVSCGLAAAGVRARSKVA